MSLINHDPMLYSKIQNQSFSGSGVDFYVSLPFWGYDIIPSPLFVAGIKITEKAKWLKEFDFSANFRHP